MSKFSDPALFSNHFNVNRDNMLAMNVFDPVLNVDTKLFIDPMLLENSSSRVFAQRSRALFTSHFETVIKFIVGSKTVQDAPWKAAQRLLQFPEIAYTCLGYGGATVRGAGGGPAQTATLIRTAGEIIDLGVSDPDLFIAMALIEDGIGPDRISDMTTKIVMPAIVEFTQDVCGRLGIGLTETTFRLANGEEFTESLPLNPYLGTNAPVFLLPKDILRDLPIATDWAGVSDAAAANFRLRASVNENIASIWTSKTKKDKEAIRAWAMQDDASFRELLDTLRGMPRRSYDLVADPAGEVFWARLIGSLDQNDIAKVDSPKIWDVTSVSQILEKIIETFRHLVEDRRLSEELYHDGKPRAEKAAQRLFFVVAHAFCKANDLDITPEADTGNGPVDFKISSGFSKRVLIEIKLSTNGKVVAGYLRQLDTYATAEEASLAYYVIIDVGGMGTKLKKLMFEKNRLAKTGKPTRPVIVVDAKRRLSASKL
ncbi:hypothetical protein ELI37_19850 [Rhizobium leguminosarum]|uniref:hypothetical protein n=1 Tax=Rhizobium leguminosarum TaxID=384 RepID=UPI00103087E2|nr:hypothetical protein [Rhizobium leguminosarum]TAV12593.1 hypothetical protein ELI37_19850 [Rhizobium leguminosarum]